MGRPGHVYVMRVDDQSVKIGFSTFPEDRAKQLGLDDVLYTHPWRDDAIVVDVDGVDYILTMMPLPNQRARSMRQ